MLSVTQVALCFAVSDARTFLTSDCDMANCRAICDGLMPALSAARTALTWPRVNETFATSACSLCFDDDCFGTDASVELGQTLVGSNRPRRFPWVAHAVSKPCPLLPPWQRPGLSAAEKHLGPYRSRKGRALLAQCGQAPCGESCRHPHQQAT